MFIAHNAYVYKGTDTVTPVLVKYKVMKTFRMEVKILAQVAVILPSG